MQNTNINPTEIKTLDVKKDNGNSFLEAKFGREKDSSIKLTLKCPRDLSFLRSTETRPVMIGGIKCFRPKDQILRGMIANFYPDNIFEYNEYPNMCVLLAHDIKLGVTFNFGVFPISDEKISDWSNKFKEQSKILYLSHCKPFSIKININTSTIEEEQHE